MAICIEGSTFVVTGGAGFIGSHLIERLLADGAKRVIALDDLRCGDWANLSFADKDSRLERLQCDFSACAPNVLKNALSGCNGLFHLAAEKHNQSIDSPTKVIDVNIRGTWQLLDAAVKVGVRKIVFTSSLYAHGGLQLPAALESDLPAPWTVYGVSKLAGEGLMEHFRRIHGLDYVTIRLWFVYGPRQFAGMGYKSVIVRNFERMIAGEAPTVYGNGTQSLDYTYVTDVADALIKAQCTDAGGVLLNIGSGMARSVIDVINEMREIARSDRSLIPLPSDWTEGTCRVCNRELAERILGWYPTTTFSEGLRATYEFLRMSNA